MKALPDGNLEHFWLRKIKKQFYRKKLKALDA